MDTVELTIPVGSERQDVLIARLEEFGFNGFQQENGRLKAYISAEDWSHGKAQYVASWLRKQGVDGPVEERTIQDRDWNELWEQNIQPIRVGPFLVKPTWAEVPTDVSDAIVLEVDPKMSFGTGYHESTRLVLRLLAGLVETGDRVLDAGAGTGILSIAAARLGAAEVIAFDISNWAERNARENVQLNGVTKQVEVRCGSIDVVPETGFDLILANIERDVLIDLMPAFAERIVPGGHVVLSGLLLEDQVRMQEAAVEHGFSVVDTAVENDWWAAVLEKG